ncbi:SET domain-containing protein [Nannocystis sp. RBIL2]|uniref:SET domain-containing protein n=1 Tax=Nannocystis sp. RBIL2 TaxID=2996788 RepID=UPI00226DD69D|nr:SET domain-containing methyltransferase [Nannocystis sp. RBIL2]MCY1066666.1 SET domain-containing protein [Nannocystis sp. RBIL2]
MTKEWENREASRPRSVASPKIELRTTDLGRGVFATEAIAAGELLIAVAHVFVAEAGQYTIQLDDDRHQAGTGEIDDFLNHACEPNAALDAERLCFVAVRPLASGDEVTFNYLTSEWDMAAAFECRCGAQRCFGTIRGFRHLSREQQDSLAAAITPFLRRKRASGLPSAA